MPPTTFFPPPELLLYATVMTATPGPLNLALLSLGLGNRRRFGLGVVLGAAAAYGAVYAVAAGAAERIAALDPSVFTALRWVAAALLLRLAWRIAATRPRVALGAELTAAARGPEGLPAGAALGAAIVAVGAKAWSSAIAAGVLFHDAAMGPAGHAAQFGAVALAAVLLFASPWLFAGLALGRRLRSARALRSVNVAAGGVLAGLAVAMVAA